MKNKMSIIKRAIIAQAITLVLLISTLVLHILNVNLKKSAIIYTFLVFSLLILSYWVICIIFPTVKSKKALNGFNVSDNIDLILKIPPIVSGYHDYIRTLKNMMEQNKKEIVYNDKNSELLALQNQINPHFLYNTLEAIRSDALCAGRGELANTVKALSTFFRYTISTPGNDLSVGDELSNVKSYFLIQNYRFGDKLKLNIDFNGNENTVLSAKLPKLTLQPIVENAIRHGLEHKVGGGTVKISFEVTNKKLIVSIKDNGVGMEAETVAKLNSDLNSSIFKSKNDNSKQSIGLKNVNTRIKLLFGANYGIHVLSQKGVGTNVHVTVPLS